MLLTFMVTQGHRQCCQSIQRIYDFMLVVRSIALFPRYYTCLVYVTDCQWPWTSSSIPNFQREVEIPVIHYNSMCVYIQPVIKDRHLSMCNCVCDLCRAERVEIWADVTSGKSYRVLVERANNSLMSSATVHTQWRQQVKQLFLTHAVTWVDTCSTYS